MFIFIDIKKNKIAKEFSIDIKDIDKIYSNIIIDITTDNIIIKKKCTFGIIMKNSVTNEESLLGILIATENYNFKNNNS